MDEPLKIQISKLVEKLATKLKAKKLKIVTAESCTGGMLAQFFTSIEGSSSWFECGYVSYSNDSKINMLGVNTEALNQHGAVSEKIALQMAEGALKNCAADIAVSITGIAGPGGGSKDKPIGTVYIATADNDRPGKVILHHFQGDRDIIRKQSTRQAIFQVLEHLS